MYYNKLLVLLPNFELFRKLEVIKKENGINWNCYMFNIIGINFSFNWRLYRKKYSWI